MAVRVISMVWDGYPGGGSDLLALLALADWSDDEGRCFPAIASISKKTRLSEKQARRVVHNLIETGFLYVTAGVDGGGMSRRYQIALDRLTPPTGGSPPVRGSPPAGGSRTVSEPSVTVNSMADRPLVGSKTADSCPHQEIINLYHQSLPTGRQVRIWNDTRKAKLRARWKEDAKRQNLDWWSKFFAYIAKSDFLTGKTSSPGRKPFEIDLEWIVTPANFVKIAEGKYQEGAAA